MLSQLKLYADDALLYRSIHTIADMHILQKDLNALHHWASVWLMAFNPSKCEFLQITNKIFPLCTHYHIDNTTLKQVTLAKYLGVIIDNRLNWSEHTRTVVAKANSALGFLRRNLSKCLQEVKCLCYNSLVRPILEYACTIWFPYHQHNVNSIEMVQRHAARFVLSNFDRHASVTQMMNSLGWVTMRQRCLKLRVIMLFKIINKLVEVSSNDLLCPLSTDTRGHQQRYTQLGTTMDCYLNSFFPTAIKAWNDLPDYIVQEKDLQRFKEQIFNLH